MKLGGGIDFIHGGDEPATCYQLQKSTMPNYYGIQLIYHGSLLMNDNIYQAPCLFITGPGQKYQYCSPPGQSRSHIYLCFSGERIQQYIDSSWLPADFPQEPVKLKNREPFYSLMREILQLRGFGGQDEYYQQKAVVTLDLLLLEIYHSANAHREDSVLFRECRHIAAAIRQHPEQNWDFKAEIKRLRISRAYFDRIFREALGATPHRYFLECRLNYAAKLLLETKLQVREIAFACGFDDEYYFSRLFRKYKMISPVFFRRNFSLH